MPYAKTASGIYKNETFTIERKTDTDQYQADKYTFKDKHGNWIIYDASGRPMSYGSRTGTTATYLYNSQYDTRPSGLEDRYGALVFSFDFDGDGNLIRVYDADAREVRYDYTDGRLTRVTDVLDHETAYEYSNGNLIKKTNAPGHETLITYNSSNDPVEVTNPGGGAYTFEYDYDKNKKQYYAMVKTPGGYSQGDVVLCRQRHHPGGHKQRDHPKG